MRILFMGTPDFAVASLRRLVEDGHEICGVFTQPDKPKNRGHKLAFSPVKEYALSQGLTVYQPTKLRDGTALELIRTLAPELTVVAAYGRILPEDILAAPKLGSINVHSSLLPKYRGAAPINWAVLNGDAVTGVTIMYMAKELDAGDIISAAETPIDPDAITVAPMTGSPNISVTFPFICTVCFAAGASTICVDNIIFLLRTAYLTLVFLNTSFNKVNILLRSVTTDTRRSTSI